MKTENLPVDVPFCWGFEKKLDLINFFGWILYEKRNPNPTKSFNFSKVESASQQSVRKEHVIST
jgi:hypothetical protein